MRVVKLFISIRSSTIMKDGHRDYGNKSRIATKSSNCVKDNRRPVRLRSDDSVENIVDFFMAKGISSITLSSCATALSWSSADGNDVRGFFVLQDSRASSKTFVKRFLE